MARKKIALFMSEITQVFQTECGKAIIDLASLHDMDVVIFASYGSYTSPYGRNLLSEIGKKSILQLPEYSSFEAIIALPGSFDINGMDREFYELVKTNASCPVILLQTGHPDFYTISAENRDTMYKMTRHFIDVHHFTDICYMSGPYMHKDSPDRLRGFVNAMRDSGLSIESNTIFEGNYWRNRGAKALDFFMQGRRSYPQAIICANDYMALSICEELKKRGVRVPEDVCVCGFDGIKEGEDTTPSLTTVTVRPEKFAEAAFQLIDDIRVVFRGVMVADELNRILDFLRADVAALRADITLAALVDHIAIAQQTFGALAVQDSLAVDGRSCLESDAARDIGLDVTGDDLDRRALRRQNQVDAGCTRKLCQALDARFHFLAADHHQIRHLIDDNQDVMHLFFARATAVVIFLNIAHTVLGQGVVTLHHFGHGPFQSR